MIYHAGTGDAISASSTRHVEGFHYILSKYEADIKSMCGEKVWLNLNLQLLGSSLDAGLTAHYDLYRGKAGSFNGMRRMLFYFGLCRYLGIKPNNLAHRLFRKVVGNSGSMSAGQVGTIKKVEG